MPTFSFDPLADAAAVTALVLTLMERWEGKKGVTDGGVFLAPLP